MTASSWQYFSIIFLNLDPGHWARCLCRRPTASPLHAGQGLDLLAGGIGLHQLQPLPAAGEELQHLANALPPAALASTAVAGQGSPGQRGTRPWLMAGLGGHDLGLRWARTKRARMQRRSQRKKKSELDNNYKKFRRIGMC